MRLNEVGVVVALNCFELNRMECKWKRCAESTKTACSPGSINLKVTESLDLDGIRLLFLRAFAVVQLTEKGFVLYINL